MVEVRHGWAGEGGLPWHEEWRWCKSDGECSRRVRKGVPAERVDPYEVVSSESIELPDRLTDGGDQ